MSTVTENEAMAKTCHASFAAAEIRTADGTGLREGGPWQCLASECMAWRWVPKSGASPDGDPNYYAGPWKGYCGLAGKP